MALNPRIESWVGRRVWVVGASYGIGAAIAQQLIGAGARLAVSARSRDLLETLTAGTTARVVPLDITDARSVREAARQVITRWGGIDLVLVVAGTYTPMRAESFDLTAARRLLEVNLMGPLNVLAEVLPVLCQQRAGAIALVSSVAGYVGLPKSLVYGPSKAALINLAESLYGDLHSLGVGVHLVNPGFVDTPLTQGNDFYMPALITPAAAARATLAGIAAGRFEIHYPQRFTLWLKLLRLLPYSLQFAAVRRLTS